MTDTFCQRLRDSNRRRDHEWRGLDPVSLSFRVLELAAEVGELASEIKRLERDRYGMAGGSVDTTNLAAEVADVLISLDSLAMDLHVDLAIATPIKFNATSVRYGLQAMFAGTTGEPYGAL